MISLLYKRFFHSYYDSLNNFKFFFVFFYFQSPIIREQKTNMDEEIDTTT